MRAVYLFLALSSAGLAVTPTLSFQAAQPLTTAGTPIDFGNHSVPRLVNWNHDGVLDLLVARGDGYLTLFRRAGASNGTDFLAGTFLTSNATGLPLRVGTGNTTVCFADISGDGKPDLVAAGTDNRVRYYPNSGTLSSPSFGSFTIIPGAAGQFALPANTGARIDIADWDKDAKLDLLTGGFEGYLTLFRNTGTPTVPAFGAAGVRFSRQRFPSRFAFPIQC